ncbi:15_t:CDS:2 [Entrophospora sp. SA101]|nr:15_t:CDS:2 [Entrophospora sp. SA101]
MFSGTKTGWELYEEFKSEFSPSAVVALFHQKLKYALPPIYVYDKSKVNRKYSCKLTYENEEWETELLYDRQKDAKNAIAKVALKILTNLAWGLTYISFRESVGWKPPTLDNDLLKFLTPL